MWLRSYLNNRLQYVKFAGARSTLNQMDFGLPEGSVLGPLLFIIYINDLSKCLNNLQVMLFADDSTIYFTHDSFDQLQKAAISDFIVLEKWFNAKDLLVNASKTNLKNTQAPCRKFHTLKVEDIRELLTPKQMHLYYTHALPLAVGELFV